MKDYSTFTITLTPYQQQWIKSIADNHKSKHISKEIDKILDNTFHTALDNIILKYPIN